MKQGDAMDAFADATLDCVSKGVIYYTNLPPGSSDSPSNKRKWGGGGCRHALTPVGPGAQGCALEVEHRVGASKTIGSLRNGNYDGQISGEYTGDNQKAAVIGRSTCTVAQKLERGTTPTGGASIQGWGASAAPLPNIPLFCGRQVAPPTAGLRPR